MRVNNDFVVERIYNYKKLEEKAIRAGFYYSRSKGDHNIYTHFKTKRHIVIPTHTIPRGLSIKIQKQIQAKGVIV